MCRRAVADELGLRLDPTQRAVDPLGGGPSLATTHEATVELHSRAGLPDYSLSARLLVLHMLTKKISFPACNPLVDYPELDALGKAPAEDWPMWELKTVDMVLGQDYLNQIWTGDPVRTARHGERGPVGTPSHFGLIIQGAVPTTSPTARETAAVGTLTHKKEDADDAAELKAPPLLVPRARPPPAVRLRSEPPLEALLREMLDLEYVGITEPKFEKQLTVREEFAVDYLEEHLEYLEEEKRFQVKLPFDPDLPPLVDNYHAALNRLKSLSSTLSHQKGKKQLYNEAMQKYLDKNHAQKVSAADEKAAQIFYLPHHGVMKLTAEGKTNKIRIVFDCSAKDRNGNSLNKSMVVGPVPDANLVQILTRFRMNKVAVGADVSECFLTVKMHPDDQNKFRFLWFNRVGEVVKYKFTSLIFGSAASPWISSTCLFKLLDRHLGKDKELVEKIKKSIWVDDIVLSEPTVKEARRDLDQLMSIFSEASFRLAKLVASDDAVLNHFPDDQLLFPRGIDRKGSMKVLGVDWSVDEDEIYVGRDFEKSFSFKKGYDTKRTVAKAVGSIYDPLGILLPWKTGGNILIKEIWSYHEKLSADRGIEKATKALWDEKLPPHLQKQVDEWKKGHEKAREIRLPRWISLDAAAESKEIYGFADASPFAFGCVTYLRVKFPNGSVQCRFLTARGKVNKVNGYSLPRCELLAAKFLATLVYNLKEFMDLPEDFPCKLFGDSTVALCWIKGEPHQWKTFVHNAVKAIHKFTSPQDWYHVPGLENPADLLTRPHSPPEILAHKEWLEGPAFAYTDSLPKQPKFYQPTAEAAKEFREPPEGALFVGATLRSATLLHPVQMLVDRYSDIRKVLRIIVRWKRAAKGLSLSAMFHPPLITYGDMVAAADELMKYVQGKLFPDEIKALSKGKPVSATSRLATLNPVWEDGLIRARGRLALLPLDHKDMSKSASAGFTIPEYNRPIVIADDGDIVPRVIRFIHEDGDHATTDSVHAQMRKRWWLLRARRLINQVKKTCIPCRKVSGRAPTQIVPPLPAQRLAVNQPPFSHVAIDGLGHIFIAPEDKRKKPEKVWVLVISCMTTRGINLELLESNDAESFVQAMRRHFAEYGKARSVRLDNFPSHKKMATLFDQLNKGKTVNIRARSKRKAEGIYWSWSARYQPSTNGVIERAVKSVKEILLKELDKTLLDRVQLTTLLKEVKQVINSRPLVQLPRGSVDDGEVITPHHLIYGHNLSLLPLGELEEGQTKSTASYWAQKQRVLKVFWDSFKSQYIDSLLELKGQVRAQKEPQVGDLVICKVPVRKRQDWPLGRIEALKTGIDGHSRLVRIRTAAGLVERDIGNIVVLRDVEEYDKEMDVRRQPDPLEEVLDEPEWAEEVEDAI